MHPDECSAEMSSSEQHEDQYRYHIQEAIRNNERAAIHYASVAHAHEELANHFLRKRHAIQDQPIAEITELTHLIGELSKRLRDLANAHLN